MPNLRLLMQPLFSFMFKTKYLFTIALTVFALLSACQDDYLAKYGLKEGRPMQLSGPIHVVGNEPFSRLAIRYKGVSVIVQAETEALFKQLLQQQGKEVTLTGKAQLVEKRTVDGKHVLREILFHATKLETP